MKIPDVIIRLLRKWLDIPEPEAPVIEMAIDWKDLQNSVKRDDLARSLLARSSGPKVCPACLSNNVTHHGAVIGCNDCGEGAKGKDVISFYPAVPEGCLYVTEGHYVPTVTPINNMLNRIAVSMPSTPEGCLKVTDGEKL